MTGSDSNAPVPTEIKLHQASRVMELSLPTAQVFGSRMNSSGSIRHPPRCAATAPARKRLQVGKREVTIAEVEAVGHYAIRPKFSDGHETGIYSWDYLYELGSQQQLMWDEYLRRLDAAGASRDADPNAAAAAPAHACGHKH